MTAVEESIYNMFREVKKVGTDYPAPLAAVTELGNAFTTLDGRINTISGLISLQAQVLTGIAIDKDQLKARMALLQFNYSGPGRAYADSLGNDAMYNSINLSKTKIIRARDDQAGPMSQNVYNVLNTNALALVPFGLVAAQLNELLTAINDYTAAVPLPIGGINQRQTYTQGIETQIRETSEFIDRRLDNIVRGQFLNFQDFHNTYFNAKEIIDPPTQSTTFNILVLNDANSNPLLQAKAEAMGTAKVEFTDAAGECALKKFRKGVYTILVSKPGFNPEQQEVPIGLGETKNLTFRLTVAP